MTLSRNGARIRHALREWLRLIGQGFATAQPRVGAPVQCRITYYESSVRATANRRTPDREEAPSAGQHVR